VVTRATYRVGVTDVASGASVERGPAARREQVRRRVLAEGFARVDDLARAFDVSAMTVHRDLDVLELEGWLTKIRGGATANPSALVEAGVRERVAAMRAEKAAIVELAARLLARGQSIFLDDSTTALGLVPYLVAHMPITVATNFLPAIASIGDSPGVDLHLLGGQYHARQEACLGLQTVDAINRLHADLFFMSTTAVTDGKCLHRSEATVMVRRAFMANAGRSVLLVDHAKFGRPAPHLLCGIDEFDTVITDDGIDPDDLDALRTRCSDVQVATVSR
jgi:DeoR/GlpR family transcriptional regulator of sugar metabolism